MKDELLIDFIEETATPASAEELNQILKASCLEDVAPAVPVADEAASRFVADALEKAGRTRRPKGKVMRLSWIAGAIAIAAMLVLAVVLPGTSDQFHIEYDNNASASDSDGLLEMLTPAATKAKVYVGSDDAEFVFEWKDRELENMHLTLSTVSGNVLFETFVEDGRYELNVSDYLGKGVLVWRLTGEGDNYESVMCSGMLEFLEK